jgi:hypothetical protein
MTSLTRAFVGSTCLPGMPRIHRQFDLAPPAHTEHFVQQEQCSQHSCLSITPCSLDTDFTRKGRRLRMEASVPGGGFLQGCPSMQVSTPSTSSWVNFHASSYSVLHSQPAPSISLGLILGIAVHGDVSANTRIHPSPHMRLYPVTEGED